MREADDLLALIRAGTREGMVDVEVALKHLRRTGRPARLVDAAPAPPSFDELWERVGADRPTRSMRF
jgi:hypothetical protein